MKYVKFLGLMVLLSLFVFSSVIAGDKEQKVLDKCPTCMSAKVKTDLSMDYEGNRFFFCCEGCAEKFKAEPAKFVEKVKEAGYALLPVEKAKDFKPAGEKKECSGHDHAKKNKDHKCTGDCKDKAKDKKCCSDKEKSEMKKQ
ncbi:MAG: hypothetical protein Kow00108_20640 [Calditrichia bacterium]